MDLFFFLGTKAGWTGHLSLVTLLPLCFLQKASNTCQRAEKEMGPLETGKSETTLPDSSPELQGDSLHP